MDGKPLENARVRYEIWNEANPDKRDWIEVKNQLRVNMLHPYTFAEAGTFQIQIHVEDDKELHEHEVYTIEVE